MVFWRWSFGWSFGGHWQADGGLEVVICRLMRVSEEALGGLSGWSSRGAHPIRGALGLLYMEKTLHRFFQIQNCGPGGATQLPLHPQIQCWLCKGRAGCLPKGINGRIVRARKFEGPNIVFGVKGERCVLSQSGDPLSVHTLD